MLVPYIDEYKKIAMGFLSYRKDLKDVEFLNKELQLFQTKDYQLYLYRRQNDTDFVGITAVNIGDDFVYIRYICLNPAYRTGKNIHHIFEDIENLHSDKHILASRELSSMVNNWKRDKKIQGTKQ